MNKTYLSYAIDCCLFILLMTSFITSFSRRLRGIHQLSGYLLVTMVAIHLFLHWRWIVSMTKTILKK